MGTVGEEKVKKLILFRQKSFYLPFQLRRFKDNVTQGRLWGLYNFLKAVCGNVPLSPYIGTKLAYYILDVISKVAP
jgi:hypothetical protein